MTILYITTALFALTSGGLGYQLWKVLKKQEATEQELESKKQCCSNLMGDYLSQKQINSSLQEELDSSKAELESSKEDIKNLNNVVENKEILIKDLEEESKTYKEETEQLKKTFDERLKVEVDLQSEKIRTEVEEEYEQALNEQIEEFGNKVKDIDKMIEETVDDIRAKNTLYFSCSCNKDTKIPVPLDFTTENRFSCDKCGSVYRVELNAYPVLLSNVSNNKVIANIFKKGEQE